MSLNDELKKQVAELDKLQPEELQIQLGIQLNQLQNQLQSELTLSAALPLAPTEDRSTTMSPDDAGFFKRLAKRFLDRFKSALYSVLCDETDPDNKEVRNALAAGSQQLGLTLVVILTATFGVLPGIAAIAATWLAKVVIQEGHGALCDVWKEELGK
jgi:hypothetical protein